MRGLRAVEQAKKNRSRRTRILYAFTACSLVAIGALVVLFGFRPSPPPPAPPTSALPAPASSPPVIRVTANQIELNGKPIASTTDIKTLQRIDPLFHALKQTREDYRLAHPGTDFPGEAVLEVDSTVTALVVKSVFHTAAYAGFPNIAFRTSGDSGPEP